MDCAPSLSTVRQARTLLAALARTSLSGALSRILVLGGYGGFGGRITRRLAAAGHTVLVAGRSLARARAFCETLPGTIPVATDRSAVATALAAHHPEILVDASGPFQAMDYAVPRACIAAGVHYLDIADGRDFVCGIGALDEAARAAGVTVLSGASSVPCLSGAVVRELAAGFDRVDAVDMAISASNRATAGPAVAASILGQVGKPIALWRGGRWIEAFGWSELQTVSFDLPGFPPLHRRVALADVPDLALLPDRLPGRPSVVFHAGTELGFQVEALRLASWLVRHRWLADLSRWAGWLLPLQDLTRKLGSDRSAMRVRLSGTSGEHRVARCWTLIADRGDGPEIPGLAIAPLVASIATGIESPGARDAGTSLSLADYQPAFDGLAIQHGTTERPMPDPLYRRVLGERFDALPASIRAMHDIGRQSGASGLSEVAGPANKVAALIAGLMGFPRPGRHAVHVDFTADDRGESWTRDFDVRRFSSRLSQRGVWLVESFGVLHVAFSLSNDDRGLTMELRRWWLGPLPLPLALAPQISAREFDDSGRFNFDVQIALPLIGRLVQYRGWLAN